MLLLETYVRFWSKIACYIDLIKNVKRKFTKRFLSLFKLSYIQRLNSLGLRFDIISYYKILNGLSPINSFNHFLIHYSISSSYSSVPHLQKPSRCKIQLFTSFFFRHVDVWNLLPFS